MSDTESASTEVTETHVEATPANVAEQAATEQAATDWKAEARKWEARSKENHEAHAKVSERLDSLTSERDALAKKVTEYEERDAHAALVAEVAESKGVPASMLRGSTREELEEHADVLLPGLRPSVPRIPGAGVQPNSTPESAELTFVKNLFSAAKAQ